jgi:squalene-hopene/tetraprenyl-beta-curcumene cyclase
VLRVIEPLFPKSCAQRAIEGGRLHPSGSTAKTARRDLSGDGQHRDDVRGARLSAGHPPRAIARKASIDKLLVIGEHEAYCQPCVSPVWDTALTCHALLEAGGEEAVPKAKQGLDWLKPKQVLDVKGDWAVKRPTCGPGGWAFQYNNAHYPDLDDTAVVVMAMDRAQRSPQPNTTPRSPAAANGSRACRAATAAGARSTPTTRILSQQHPVLRPRRAARSADRGRHRALRLDAGAARRDRPRPSNASRGIDYLRAAPSSRTEVWYGRWGMNYIYGTWSVLCALNAAGVDPQRPDDAQGGGLAALDPEQRWRLGRGCRQLQARLQGITRRPRAPPRKRHGPCLD